MPSKSLKQHQLMLAVSNNKDLADKYDIDQEVAKEFVKKDQEAGLYAEASLESFDESELDSTALESLIPTEEELESLKQSSQEEYSEESHDDAPPAPFRFNDRFEA